MLLLHVFLLLPADVLLRLFVQPHGQSSLQLAFFHTEVLQLLLLLLVLRRQLQLLNIQQKISGVIPARQESISSLRSHLLLPVLGAVHAALEILQQVEHLLDLSLSVSHALDHVLQLHHALVRVFL